MNLTETPEIVNWPETHYVFIEKTGPFMQTAGAAWQAAHALSSEVLKQNRIIAYTSLYKMGPPNVYRAGFGLDAPPVELPEGLAYEHFAGGKYSRFTLVGSYRLLPQASGRVWDLVKELGIKLRDDFAIENYANDPRTTAEDELITQILVPTV